MFEIIKLLLPLIIQLLGDKKKAGKAKDADAAINCWRSPADRAEFVGQVIAAGLEQGRVMPDEIPLIIAAFEDVSDSPLLPLFVDSLYAQPALKGE